MQKIKSLLKSLWANDGVRRVVHTFWQAFVSVFAISITGLAPTILSVHDFSDAKSLVVALVAAAGAAVLAAIKAVVVK